MLGYKSGAINMKSITKGAVLIIFLVSTLIMQGCSDKGGAATSVKPIMTIEAETGEFTGNVKAHKDKSYSGEGYVDGFEADDDTAEITFEVKKDGFYDLGFVISSKGGHKENTVLIDGIESANLVCEDGPLKEITAKRIYLTKGSHKAGIKKLWGWIRWDSMNVYESEKLPKDIYKVTDNLINPNASPNAKRLMKYLADIYGKKILSGQYAEGGYGSWEVFKLKEVNGGKEPAVIGLELGHCCKTAINHEFHHPTVEDAIKVWEKGGIVTMCYHWLAPEKYLKDIWWQGFRTNAVDIPLEKIVNGEDEEGLKLIMDDIDILAEELKKLADLDIPILFRPLHEAAGGWFWWGDHGADAYIKLYKIMYERLTDYHGLNNLIWIWNGQDGDWYPGDEYVDIVGTDIYPGEHEYASHIGKYLELYDWAGPGKMIVLSENGTMPDIEAVVRDGAMWGFFATWNGEFVITDGPKISYSEQYTEKEKVKEIYNHEAVLTLDELPDLKNYK